jgi:ABC-type branched-subunit amino acid transport system substrate-binding protein
VGLSDGRAFFDVYGDQQSTDWKKQVEQFLREGENDQAQDMRNTILSTYTNDAETYSYRDSFLVTTTSGSPYFTIVIGTDITQSRSGGGRDILQGAYIAAWEYNQRQSARKVRLWIANTTADQDISKQVTNQILKVAAKEKTIIGMVGWPDSQSCQAALDAMSNADGSNAIRLPMVSPTASAVPLANYPYFFRACPTNDDQAKIAVDHISPPTTNQFIAIFKAEGDFFSEDLAEAFYRQCADKHFSSEKFSYKAGEPDTIAAARREAYTNSAPQAIYFAGVVPDLNTLIADLNSNVSTRPMIMGGDTLYIVTDRISSYQNLQFTAFAFPDEWSNQKTKPKYLNNNEWDTKKQRPMFFTNYANIFDLLGQHPGTYSYSRPDAEAIMAYDAMKTLLYAIDRAWQQANKQPTPDEVRNALTEINEKIHPLQGISGPIQFAPDGNVINKPCVMLSVDGSGLTQPVSISGTLIAS